MREEQREKQRGSGAGAMALLVALLAILLVVLGPLLLGNRQQEIGDHVLAIHWETTGSRFSERPVDLLFSREGLGTCALSGQIGRYSFGWAFGPEEDWL